MNIFHLNSRNCRCLTNILLFMTCIALCFIGFRLLELSQSAKLEAQSEVKDAPVIRDFIPGQLRLSAPDAEGKVRVVISMEAKIAADYIDKRLHMVEQSSNEPAELVPEVRIIKQNTGLCGNITSLKYIVLVQSKPEAQSLRDVLRQTWANPKLFKGDISRLAFMVGKPLDDREGNIQARLDSEFQLYGDIVQGDFIDTMRNSTLKAVMGLNWILKYCPQASYTVRAVDETFVNIFELVRMMDRHVKESRVMMCPLWKDHTMPILRDPKVCGVWCVKDSDLPGQTHFPQYCASMLCVLSHDLVAELHHATRATPWFWISEVYLTGLLPKHIPHPLHYVDMLGSMSLNWNVVAQEYLNSTHALTISVTQFQDVVKTQTLWKALLKRLPAVTVDQLSDAVKAQLS